MKNIVKDFVFIIIFLILLNICTNIFVLKGNGFGSDIYSFYNQKRNSLDIVFFGSSHSYSAFSPDIIKEETGLNSYNFATQQQPISVTYYYMKEALKRQNAKYFVLEAKMLIVDYDYAKEGVVRDAVDKLPPSINKIMAINESVENKKDWSSYYFNIIKYHSRYNDLNIDDIKIGFTRKGINNNGFTKLEENVDTDIDNSKVLNIDERKKISSKNLKYLKRIIKLAKNNNTELIIVKSPCELSEDEQKYYNWLEDYLSKENIDFINYNKKINDLNLVSGDFYDYGHLSYSGAKKLSRDFSKYIKEKEDK